MIRSVEISGLRGIREGKLEDFTPLVVLVGPNGSGKSTVLEALLLGASPVPAEAIGRAVQRHRGVGRGARWLFWKGGENDHLSITIASDKAQRACSLAIDRTAPPDATAVRCFFNGHDIVTVTFAFGNTYSVSVHADPPHRPLDPIRDVRLVEVPTNELQLPLHQLFTSAVERGRREHVKALVAELLPGLDNIEILTEGEKPILQLVYADRSVPAVLAGDGIQSLLRLGLELAGSTGVVLVEEPELHQHPGAIRQSARAILAAVRRGIQVILTTHSLDFIDSLLSESTVGGHTDLDKLSLYRTGLKDGRLLATRYSGAEVASARGAIQDDLR